MRLPWHRVGGLPMEEARPLCYDDGRANTLGLSSIFPHPSSFNLSSDFRPPSSGPQIVFHSKFDPPVADKCLLAFGELDVRCSMFIF